MAGAYGNNRNMNTAYPSSNSCVKIGKVKFFNDQKGYGFIIPEEGGSDVFVHHTQIMGTGFKSLQEDQPVQYEIEQKGQKGIQAVNVCPCNQ